jgi:D-glycero-D-manno-heptose 1,7-bisphosphate phosphatase
MRGAVFLDRDGVINVEVDYLSSPEELELIPGAAQAIARLNALSLPAVVVTNQAGVARGYFSLERVGEIHRALERLLEAEAGARLDAVYVCPHHPSAGDRCSCRKPEPGLLLAAAREHGLDLARSFLVGDKASDIDAGRRAGCATILVQTGYGAAELRAWSESFRPDHVADDLGRAVDWIAQRIERSVEHG